MHSKYNPEDSVAIHPTQLRNTTEQHDKGPKRLEPGLVIHVDDMLGDDRRSDLEMALSNRAGINDAYFNASRPHLLLVNYDPRQINSLEVLNQVQRQNVRAQLIGPV